MANFFQKAFGAGRKPQSVSWEGLKSLKQIPETSQYMLPWIQRQYSEGPEYWRDKYYNEVFQPAADYTRGVWNEEVQAPIMAEAGAMGMATSSPTIDRLAKELAKRELNLAQYAGQLRAQGLETGRQERGTAQNRMGEYVQNEAAQQNYAADRIYNASVANEQAIRDYNVRAQEMPYYRTGQMLGMASGVVDMFSGGNTGNISNILGKTNTGETGVTTQSRSPYDFLNNPFDYRSYYKPQNTMQMSTGSWDGGMGPQSGMGQIPSIYGKMTGYRTKRGNKYYM